MTTITSRPRPRPRPTCPAPSARCAPPATSTAPSRRRSATTCSPGCRAGDDPFPGIVGFDDTVLPELERALLAGHDLVLLGERGQGKTRLIRTLVGLLDEWTPGDRRRARSTSTRYAPDHAVGPAPRRRARRRRSGRLAAPQRAVRREARDARHQRRRPDRRRRPDQGRRGPHPRRPRDGPLRPGAAHQPRHLRRQRAARPRRADPGVAAQRARGARHPGARLRAAAAARPAARREREPGGLHEPRPHHHPAQGPVRRRDPHPLPAARWPTRSTLVRQEADLVAVVPEHLVEVVARFTRAVRESPAVDARSGVSARFAVAGAETVAASALRRAAITGEAERGGPRVRPARRGRRRCAARWSSRSARRAASSEVLDHLLRRAVAETFRARLGGVDLSALVAPSRTADGRDRRPGAAADAARAASAASTGLGRIVDRDWAARTGESPGVVAACAGDRAGGPVPDPAHRPRTRCPAAARVVYGGRLMASGPGAMTALPVRRLRRRPRPAGGAVRRRGRAVDELGERRPAGPAPARRAARPAAARRGRAARPRRPACAGAQQRRSSRARPAGRHPRRGHASCSTRPSARSGRRCSPTRPTTPGCARPSWTTLPRDTARAVRELGRLRLALAGGARRRTTQLRDMLRREVLDQQFRGMKEALQSPDPARTASALKDMLADLNRLLEKHARGEDTTDDFDAFMERTASSSPTSPQNLEELRRRAGPPCRSRRADDAQSLTAEQREELAGLMAEALGDLDLSAEMGRLGDNLRALRPDLPWTGRQRHARRHAARPRRRDRARWPSWPTSTRCPTGSRRTTRAPSLADIDEEPVRRALGRAGGRRRRAAAARSNASSSSRATWSVPRGELELSPKAVRRLGQTALRQVFASLDGRGRGDHDIHDAGATGELTGTSRQWRFGDEQPWDGRHGAERAAAHGFCR